MESFVFASINSNHLSIYLSICLSIICLSVYLSIDLPTYQLFMYLSFCLSFFSQCISGICEGGERLSTKMKVKDTIWILICQTEGNDAGVLSIVYLFFSNRGKKLPLPRCSLVCRLQRGVWNSSFFHHFQTEFCTSKCAPLQ